MNVTLQVSDKTMKELAQYGPPEEVLRKALAVLKVLRETGGELAIIREEKVVKILKGV